MNDDVDAFKGSTQIFFISQIVGSENLNDRWKARSISASNRSDPVPFACNEVVDQRGTHKSGRSRNENIQATGSP